MRKSNELPTRGPSADQTQLSLHELDTERHDGIINKDLYAAIASGSLVNFRSSTDPKRTLGDLLTMARLMQPQRKVISWTTAQSATNVASGKPVARLVEEQRVSRTTDPDTGNTVEVPERHVSRVPIVSVSELFTYIFENKDPSIYFLPNWHLAWGETMESRRPLVDMLSGLWERLSEQHKTIVMQSPLSAFYPPELATLTIPVTETPVSTNERAKFINRAIIEARLVPNQEIIQRLIQATTGMNLTQLHAAIRTALVKEYDLSPKLVTEVMAFKKAQLESGGIWSQVPTHGVPELVGWERLFGKIVSAKQYGAFEPGSVHNQQLYVLVGQAGTGKTTAAQQIGRILGWPLYQGEVSAMMGSLMGQTEQGVKRAVDEIYAAQPCVALLDEGQRGLQSNDQRTGGGTMNRAIQAILKGIEDGRQKGHQVLWVVTANEVDTLPPELFSRGQIWAVNFPDASTRVGIFDSIFRRFAAKDSRLRRDPSLTKQDIAMVTDGYAGRDIEKLISEAAIRGRGTVSLGGLLDARPLVVSQEELDPTTVARRAQELSRYPSVGSTPSSTVYDSTAATSTSGVKVPRTLTRPALGTPDPSTGKSQGSSTDVRIRVD